MKLRLRSVTCLSLACFASLVSPARLGAQPIILVQPTDTSVPTGCSAFLGVGASGLPDVWYQWSKNGTIIPGATQPALFFSPASPDDSGVYSVLASNVFGSVQSQDAVLWVSTNVRPVISTQPQPQTLSEGGTISLAVTASGTPPLAYQWWRNGMSLIGGTNAAYVKTNAHCSDMGSYSVLVTDCSGTRASSPAQVSVNCASATPFTLIGLTNQFWRYHQSGLDLGSAWREPAYNDSAWPQGRGLFARENNPTLLPLTNTVLSLTNGGGAVNTYYFRTHFTLTNDPREVLLVASNLFDDGGVVYLNGTEIYRVNMPAGNIGYATLASFAPTEGMFVLTNLPSDRLLLGDNVLAVEVHQVNAASSDVVFGFGLATALLPSTPLIITNQPRSLTVEEGKAASLTVGFRGGPAWFRWDRSGLALANATTNPLVLPIASTNDAGSYWVVVSNAYNTVTSAMAVLTVSQDTDAPVLVEADWGSSLTNIMVQFSERLLAATATNPASYKVTNTQGGTLSVLSATLQPDGSNVWLRTTPRALGNNYLLIANGLRDASSRSNLIAANSAMPVRSMLSLLPFTSRWWFYQPFPPFTDPDLGTAWKEFNYFTDDGWWGASEGGFYLPQNPSEVEFPGPLTTLLSQSTEVITYFRAGFNLPASPGGLQLQFTHIVDDGGILYLNGQEILRHNMPSGAVNYLTPSESTLGVAARIGPVVLPGSENIFRPGSNVVAFELHQALPIDVDMGFALQLDASVQSFTNGPVFITGGPWDVTVPEGGSATFTVNQAGGASFRWQQESNAIPGGSNAALVIPSLPLSLNGAHFRVAVSNAISGQISSNATLRVLPDTNRPILLAATGTGSNSITLSFSELLSAASVTNLANYAVTNLDGSINAPVIQAVLVNGTNVILTFAAPLAGSYFVTVNNVRDASAAQNIIAANGRAGVSAHYFISMTSAWKYLTINTNEMVQASFMHPNYDDSTWAGPSNALFYLASAALPAPKNTPLVHMLNGQYISTHYFRQSFFAPFASPVVAIQLRHIIDDGLVLHLNGREIYRFNMPAGPVTAGTISVGTVSDATLEGPITIVVTNFVPGTNVLAVDLHPTGPHVSADRVMGVEASIHVPPPTLLPNTPLPPSPPAPLPVLNLARFGEHLVLDWDAGDAPGFVLEEASTVTGPWTPLGGTSPYFTLRTNAASFYRLLK